MMHRVRGFFPFARINGLIPADPAVYARLPKVRWDEYRTQWPSLRHAAITNALDAGVRLRDAHGVHFLTAYVAGV